jgi:hypothetical protein
MLQGLPWFLAGGLAIPVTLGRFYRRHHDVDIAFPVDAFPEVETAMQRAGYALWTYFPMSLFGACRAALLVRIHATGALARWRPRKLKFHDASGARPRPHLLQVIEALPYRVVDGCFATCDGRHRVPLDRPLAGCTVLTPAPIQCLDLHYVARLKQGRREPKDLLDLDVIRDRALPAAPAFLH